MSKALGLIETRGLVAAIEAADAMVKAANVVIIGKEITRPALVTIKITGDVAAVKSAVDAGESAARKVGQVVSVHIIPQPDDQVYAMLPEIEFTEIYNNVISEKHSPISEVLKDRHKDSIKNEIDVIHSDEEKVIDVASNDVPVKERSPKREKINKPEKKVITKEKEISISEIPDSNFSENLFESSNDTISRLRKEALLGEDLKSNTAQSDAGNNPTEYENLNVHQLRHLARSMESFPIKGREISKANRQELINLFKKL